MIVAGLDIGGSVTKGVLLNESKIWALSEVQASDSIASGLGCLGKLLSEAKIKMKDVSEVALTGSISRGFKFDMTELKYGIVNEIDAVGIGGLFLSGKKEAIVASIGTGTAIVHAKAEGTKYHVEHLGGTGVGGGTMVGLGKLLLNKDQTSTIFKKAKLGDISRTNLLVQDIIGGPIGIIPANATASNFGKVGDETRSEDIALGLIVMIAETIATITYFAAKQKNLEKEIVYVGRLPAQELFAKKLTEILGILGGKATIPVNALYATAIGAAKAIRQKK
jgi:type II pantothenate kinase